MIAKDARPPLGFILTGAGVLCLNVSVFLGNGSDVTPFAIGACAAFCASGLVALARRQ